MRIRATANATIAGDLQSSDFMCAYDQFILIESGFQPFSKRRPPRRVQIIGHDLVHHHLVPHRMARLFLPKTRGWCSSVRGEATETLRQLCHKLVKWPALEGPALRYPVAGSRS